VSHDPGVAAWVGDQPIRVAAVEARLAAMRTGPYAARLPQGDTAESRNLRRWLVQAMTTEAVVAHEAAVRGIAAGPGGPEPVTLAAALRTGGMTAAVVAAHPRARALRDRVTASVSVSAAEVRAYYDRNRDLFTSFASFTAARPVIVDQLSTAARDKVFARWLDERCAALVRLEPGFEHPGDPGQPDYAHQH
jgi:[acyl-carrier-protein] S-malonyltransferase